MNSIEGALKIDEEDPSHRYHALQGLRTQEIELIISMAVHGQLTGLVALGGKASGEPFSP